MLQARREAARVLGDRLYSAEKALARAMVEVAALVDATETARDAANLSMVVGHEPAFDTVQCMAALGNARANLVKAHKGFAVTLEEIGLRPMAFGVGGGDKPENLFLQAAPALAAVA